MKLIPVLLDGERFRRPQRKKRMEIAAFAVQLPFAVKVAIVKGLRGYAERKQNKRKNPHISSEKV